MSLVYPRLFAEFLYRSTTDSPTAWALPAFAGTLVSAVVLAAAVRVAGQPHEQSLPWPCGVRGDIVERFGQKKNEPSFDWLDLAQDRHLVLGLCRDAIEVFAVLSRIECRVEFFHLASITAALSIRDIGFGSLLVSTEVSSMGWHLVEMGLLAPQQP